MKLVCLHHNTVLSPTHFISAIEPLVARIGSRDQYKLKLFADDHLVRLTYLENTCHLCPVFFFTTFGGFKS